MVVYYRSHNSIKHKISVTAMDDNLEQLKLITKKNYVVFTVKKFISIIIIHIFT